MRTATQISADEYLHTTFDPDVDFVDGVLEERNLGEYTHGRLQGLIFAYLLGQQKTTGKGLTRFYTAYNFVSGSKITGYTSIYEL